jgi:transcriptional regulator with XRE-family HTH domain
MDSMQRCGATFRAVRIKRGWRQIDVAARARVHRSVVSGIERGHLERVSIGTLLEVARALEIQVTFGTRWRAGDLDRLIAGRHSRLHEAVALWFATALPDWIIAPEVSFSIFGERGIIDILAWHPGRRALLVIELKTDLADVNELIGTMGPASAPRVGHRQGPRMGAAHSLELGARGRRTDEPGSDLRAQDAASHGIPGRRSDGCWLVATARSGDPRAVALGQGQ